MDTTLMFFALIDCNNFYVSCERLFNPSLDNKPVVILSNNDGCVISRSNEAKALGIKMADPHFKIKEFCSDNKVIYLSCNYQLYGDISNRIMAVLKELLQNVEIYSIDEAFITIKNNSHVEIIEKMEYVKKIINKWLGIPISIGIGKTKTLAKLANRLAKKNEVNIFALVDDQVIEHELRKSSVADIWGIGKRNLIKLNELKINTAYDLANTNPKLIRKRFGVLGERIVLELRSIPCFQLEESPKPKKNIVVSRSFGNKIKDLMTLEEALANHVWSACVKMRAQNSKARGVNVFLKTSRFESDKDYYFDSKVHWLIEPTSDTRVIIEEAKTILKSIYKAGYNYHKVGITLLELVSTSYAQGNLLLGSFPTQKINPLMSLLDQINHKMGRGTIKMASQGVKNKDLGWRMRSFYKSPKYTTCWNDLVTIFI